MNARLGPDELRRRRLELGLTRRELARRAAVDLSVIEDAEAHGIPIYNHTTSLLAGELGIDTIHVPQPPIADTRVSEPLTSKRPPTPTTAEDHSRRAASTRDNGDYQGNMPSDTDAIMRSMNTTSTSGRPHLVLVEAQPWYATAPTTARERKRDLEDQRSRLLALAVGDHLPIELAQRAADLTAQLEQGA